MRLHAIVGGVLEARHCNGLVADGHIGSGVGVTSVDIVLSFGVTSGY